MASRSRDPTPFESVHERPRDRSKRPTEDAGYALDREPARSGHRVERVELCRRNEQPRRAVVLQLRRTHYQIGRMLATPGRLRCAADFNCPSPHPYDRARQPLRTRFCTALSSTSITPTSGPAPSTTSGTRWPNWPRSSSSESRGCPRTEARMLGCEARVVVRDRSVGFSRFHGADRGSAFARAPGVASSEGAR